MKAKLFMDHFLSIGITDMHFNKTVQIAHNNIKNIALPKNQSSIATTIHTNNSTKLRPQKVHKSIKNSNIYIERNI